MTSLSSASSFDSTSFEQHSRDSRLTESTSFNTLLDSVDTIFGSKPELHFHHPGFSDPMDWEGPTDEKRWHALVSKAEIGEGIGLREDFWHHDDLYDQTDEEFDVVAAVRARLMRSEPTATTRRALGIIERRSRAESTSPESVDPPSIARKVVVVDAAEEIEDYTADFELSDGDVFEVCLSRAICLYFLADYL